MRVLYPFNPLNEKQADEPYQEEFSVLKNKGLNCSLFDFDVLNFDEFNPIPSIKKDEVIVYRGWMLNLNNYKKFIKHIKNTGGMPLTSYENYKKCHHLLNWYDSCSKFTAETKFFLDNECLESEIKHLGWDSYFVKDYVKSNNTELGSIASSPKEVLKIIGLIKKFRGEIEGGIAIRKVEDYKRETEIRYFVFNGKVHSPNTQIPDIVIEIASKIDAPFYSIDMVQKNNGTLRLVEIGDGQVSDKKMWSIKFFASIFVQ